MPPLSLRIRFILSLWVASRLLPLQVRQNPLGTVLRLANPVHPGRYTGLPREYIAKWVLKITRHPWLMRNRRCLRQGLLGSRFLAEAGYKPQLHFGVSPDSLSKDRVSAHCWVCVDEIPVINDRLDGMDVLYTHPTSPLSP